MICCKNIVNVVLFFFNSSNVISATTIFFFFPPISDNDIATIAKKKKKIPYFDNAIATIGFPCTHSHFKHPLGSSLDRRNFGDSVVENQKFLSPTFSFSLSYFLLNFNNDIAEIHSLSLHP